MTNSNNQQAVAVKTRVNAGALDAAIKVVGAVQGSFNHNETVAVKTRLNAGVIGGSNTN